MWWKSNTLQSVSGHLLHFKAFSSLKPFSSFLTETLFRLSLRCFVSGVILVQRTIYQRLALGFFILGGHVNTYNVVGDGRVELPISCTKTGAIPGFASPKRIKLSEQIKYLVGLSRVNTGAELLQFGPPLWNRTT